MSFKLNNVQVFLTVVDAGSFTQAAVQLGISKAMTSIHIKNLEEELGVTLLLRSTRSLALTEIGQDFYNNFKDIFFNAEQAIESARQRQKGLAGTLRLTSTSEYGEKFILPLLPEFCEMHPELNIHYSFDSSFNDLVSQQIDVAIRLGNLRDSSIKSRKLGQYRILLTASPDFVSRHALTQREDLDRLPWISNSNLSSPVSWTLEHAVDLPWQIQAQAKYTANASRAIHAMTLAGLGISILPEWLVAEDIRAGRLLHLFPAYTLPSQAIQAVFPNSTYMPYKSRVFIDFLLLHLTATAD